VDGPGQVFPGLFGNAEMAGSGKTNVLRGMTILTVGKIVGFQEGIIDMSGPGADYTPFSQTINLVILCDKAEGLPQHRTRRSHPHGWIESYPLCSRIRQKCSA
jgi:glycine reductase